MSGLHLRDLQAPAWTLVLGETRFSLRPLSLRTFAEAEMYGLTLGRLSSQEDHAAWIELLCFLSGTPPTDTPYIEDTLLPAVLTDPLGFEQFRMRVAESFSGQGQEPAQKKPDAPKKGPRKVQRFKPPEEAAKEAAEQTMDYAFLLDIARVSGVGLGDLLNMTFYGVTQISASMERMPPMPGLGGLMG